MSTLDCKLQKIQNFCKLNNDIMHIIIPYTHSYQSREILEDIISYIHTLNIINNYYNRWYPYPDFKHSNNFWLNNHIWWFLKEGLTREDHIGLLLKCKRLKIYKIYSRLYKFLNLQNIDINEYLRVRLKKLDTNKHNTTQLILENRVIWGLLKPNERVKFIENTLEFL